MGAAFARNDLPVISISGDGGIQMNIQELATIVEHRIPLKIFNINNGYLGMVRQWQELFWKRRYSHVALLNPDFVKLAEAYGALGLRATETSELKDTIDRALSFNEGPVVVEFKVVPEDNVFPMIPSGQSVNEMIDTPDELLHLANNGDGEEQIVYVYKGRKLNYQQGAGQNGTGDNTENFAYVPKQRE
jgi:acetolactate synthase I/II/III large subunit